MTRRRHSEDSEESDKSAHRTRFTRILYKLWVYLRPFVDWRFLISYAIPFLVVNGWAWFGALLLPVVGPNWFTVAATTWLGILWLPCTPEKLVTIPAAIWIHTQLFKHDKKTHYKLVRMYAEARKDWQHIKQALRRHKENNDDRTDTTRTD